MNLRKDHYRGLSRGRARAGRPAAPPICHSPAPCRALRGPRGGPQARRGLPVPLPSLPLGTACRERGPRGGPRARGRATAVGRAAARAPRSPARLSRGHGGVLPARAGARPCRRGQRRSAAGPPLRRGAAGWSLAAAAGAAERRPRLSVPVPEFARAWLLREPRAGGRGSRLGPLPEALSPLARRALARLRYRRLRRFSPTRACALPGRRGPPRPRRHPASRLRWRPPPAGALLRGPAPPRPTAVRCRGGFGARPSGPRGAPRSERGRQRAGRGAAGAGCDEPRRPSPLGQEEEAASGGEDGAAGRERRERRGSSGVAGGVSRDPARTVSGCCGAARPAAQGKGLRAFRAGARRRVGWRRRPPPHLSPRGSRGGGGSAAASSGGQGPRRAVSRASGRPEPRLSSRAQRRATEGNPGPREGGRGGGGGCRARPRGRTLPRGRQRGRHPRGACRSFPSPQGQVPSVRASAALPR